jgi:phosphoribosylformylglycinamidine cyclo-ligase
MSIYSASGVDYEVLDAGKRAAVAASRQSSAFPASRGVNAIDASRGEPAFVYQLGQRYMAQVLECLGTKSTIARAYQDVTGINHFEAIGYDSVAAIVNDIICVGALPLVVNAYFATGSPTWYSADGRFEALIKGWFEGCRASAATWGGGESPGLSGIVSETEIDIAGSATGALPEGRQPILGAELQAGDEIVFVASSGLHANGASLVRRIVKDLPDGYKTQMNDGVAFGDGVLTPSVIYVDLVENLLQAKLPVTYLSHITGHGMRKVMRADRDFTYRITQLPPVPEVLRFMSDALNFNAEDAYGTFNMGAGFAVYCRPGSSDEVIRIAKDCGHDAWLSGMVEEGKRQVILEPASVTYTDEHLQLR